MSKEQNGRNVRWDDNLICPSPVLPSQKRKGWFNRSGYIIDFFFFHSFILFVTNSLVVLILATSSGLTTASSVLWPRTNSTLSIWTTIPSTERAGKTRME
jgi:hypothetical protein